MKRKVTLLLGLCLLFVMGFTTSAYASTWEVNAIMPQTSATFFIEEYEEDGSVVVPCSFTLGGSWEEDWNGTSGGTAKLYELWQSAVLFNYQGAWFVDDFYPEMSFNNVTYEWEYQNDWTLHSQSNNYNEGYSYPGDSYDTGSLTNTAYVYATSGDAINPIVEISGNVN